MKRFLFLSCVCVMSVSVVAQGYVQINYTDGTSRQYPLDIVDSLQADPFSNKIKMTLPASEKITPTSVIQESLVQLSKADVKQSFNQLLSVSFYQAQNSGKLQSDISVKMNGRSAVSLVIPYVTDFTKLKVNLETTGSYVYLNGTKYDENTSYDFSNPVKVQVVAFNGDVCSYELKVTNSSFPILSVDGSNTITDKWTEKNITISSNSGSVIFAKTTGKVKGKGSHFKNGLKNSYNLKFEEKQSILDFASAKRWVLLSSQFDPSLLRIPVGFDLARQLFTFDWVPSVEPVELMVDGQYMGTYFLMEQIRVCKGRVEDGYIISAESEVSDDDDAFTTSLSQTRWVVKDPESGFAGAPLIRTKQKLDLLESNLKKNVSVSENLADLKSFADWFVFQEWLKNSDMLNSDDYMTVRPSGVLAMGPVDEQSKSFGSGDEFDVSGWVSKDYAFVSWLLNNKTFRQYVSDRLDYLINHQEDILSIVEKRYAAIIDGASGNEVTWHSLNAEQVDVETVTSELEKRKLQMVEWLVNRLQWMKQNF
ncbi:MAG: CotH kinase family protein [Paludibacteraceae bacterium]|nr:CotH kinase family protein [Paludibacteraceae bacterium]